MTDSMNNQRFMSSDTKARAHIAHALSQAQSRTSYIINFLVASGHVVQDLDQRRVDSGRPTFTHLSLDGAGGGIFRVPWDANDRFVQAFVRAQEEFLCGQRTGDPYSMSPPPSVAEFIANCDYIRPVFDLDLWDEGTYELDTPLYA